MSEPKAKPDPKLPVLNIDEDPDNANWLRIIAARKAARGDKVPTTPAS